jgi:hypothetical protein
MKTLLWVILLKLFFGVEIRKRVLSARAVSRHVVYEGLVVMGKLPCTASKVDLGAPNWKRIGFLARDTSFVVHAFRSRCGGYIEKVGWEKPKLQEPVERTVRLKTVIVKNL